MTLLSASYILIVAACSVLVTVALAIPVIIINWILKKLDAGAWWWS